MWPHSLLKRAKRTTSTPANDFSSISSNFTPAVEQLQIRRRPWLAARVQSLTENCYVDAIYLAVAPILVPAAISRADSRIRKSYWCPYTSTLQNAPHRQSTLIGSSDEHQLSRPLDRIRRAVALHCQRAASFQQNATDEFWLACHGSGHRRAHEAPPAAAALGGGIHPDDAPPVIAAT